MHLKIMQNLISNDKNCSDSVHRVSFLMVLVGFILRWRSRLVEKDASRYNSSCGLIYNHLLLHFASSWKGRTLIHLVWCLADFLTSYQIVVLMMKVYDCGVFVIECVAVVCLVCSIA